MPALCARYGLLECQSAFGVLLLMILRLRLRLHLRGKLRKKQGKEGTSSNTRLTFHPSLRALVCGGLAQAPSSSTPGPIGLRLPHFAIALKWLEG